MLLDSIKMNLMGTEDNEYSNKTAVLVPKENKQKRKKNQKESLFIDTYMYTHKVHTLYVIIRQTNQKAKSKRETRRFFLEYRSHKTNNVDTKN